MVAPQTDAQLNGRKVSEGGCQSTVCTLAFPVNCLATSGATGAVVLNGIAWAGLFTSPQMVVAAKISTLLATLPLFQSLSCCVYIPRLQKEAAIKKTIEETGQIESNIVDDTNAESKNVKDQAVLINRLKAQLDAEKKANSDMKEETERLETHISQMDAQFKAEKEHFEQEYKTAVDVTEQNVAKLKEELLELHNNVSVNLADVAKSIERVESTYTKDAKGFSDDVLRLHAEGEAARLNNASVMDLLKEFDTLSKAAGEISTKTDALATIILKERAFTEKQEGILEIANERDELAEQVAALTKKIEKLKNKK
jgi:cytochrome c556